VKQQSKCMLTALGCMLICSISLAQTPAEPRIKFGPAGRSICEDYAKLLNQTKAKEPLQVCGSQIDQLPGAKPLEWQKLKISDNLELLHKIEWLLRTHIKPEPPQKFEEWLKQFQRRVKKPASLPRIKQARVSVEPEQPPQLVYSYEKAGSACSTKKSDWRDTAFGAFILIDYEIQTRHFWAGIRGYPFIYGDRFHLFAPYLSDKTHFLEWTAFISTFDGKDSRGYGNSAYQASSVCSFSDTEIFYPPPRR
jgi:hypothetical protein